MTLFWLLLNTLFRLGITGIVVWKLTAHRDNFKPAERIGMGLAGGAVLLTLPQIWADSTTPFELWASTIFSMGIFVYFCGRLHRHLKHSKNNRDAKTAARKHMERKR